MTLMIAMDYIPFPSERQFLAFVRANYLSLFPNLLEQSQFNRRARQAAPLLEMFRQNCLMASGVALVNEGLLDTKPVPVMAIAVARSRAILLVVPIMLLFQSKDVLFRLQIGHNQYIVWDSDCV